MTARTRLAALSIAIHLVAGCGGGATQVAPHEHLGVQSNSSSLPVTLRLAPAGPIVFATELHVTLTSEVLGEPMNAEIDTRAVRRVLAVRPDGALEIEERNVSHRYSVTMMGNTETGPARPDAPGEPDRYVLGDRGRRLESAPGASAPPEPGGTAPRGLAALMQSRLATALDPMMRALEYPERAVSVGDSWGAHGRIALADIDPAMQGEALYRLTQRLERFEGSGAERMAIISFEGTLEGAGRGGAGSTPADGGVGGRISLRGVYAVALVDGFSRTGRAELDGEARLGPQEVVRFPIRGEIRWDAAPIPTEVR